MKLWRVVVIPVELTAGLETSSSDRETGQTLVTNLPDFIATSSSGNDYIEMNFADFLSCSQIVNGFQTCGNTVHIISNGQKHPSCAYAIFNDLTQDAKNVCQIAYEPTPPRGYARQLGNDDTFLMVADPKDTQWLIKCPENVIGETLYSIRPCSLCRVEIPCKCSMTGSGFFLPKRITGCVANTLKEKIPTRTHIHRNILPVIEFANLSSISNVRSYEARINNLFPLANVVPISFQIPDKIPTFLEREQKFQTNYRKLQNRIQKELKSYETDIDEALVKSRNFSQLVFTDGLGSMFGLQSLWSSVFAPIKNFFSFICLILSPFVISYFSFIITFGVFLIKFFPEAVNCLKQCREWHQDRMYQRGLEKLAEEEVELIEF